MGSLPQSVLCDSLYDRFLVSSILRVIDSIHLWISRFPGPVINTAAWVPQKAGVLPNKSGCGFVSGHPPNWAHLPFLFQAIYDLLVFVLCLAKVNSTQMVLGMCEG